MIPRVQNFGQLRSPSLRVIQVFTGEWPFPQLSRLLVESELLEGKRPTRPSHPAVIEPLWSLMQRCWDQDPQSRPTVMEVLECLEEIAPDVEDKWAPRQERRNTTQEWPELINRFKDPLLCPTPVEFSALLKSLASGDGNIKGEGNPAVIGPRNEDTQTRPIPEKVLQDLELMVDDKATTEALPMELLQRDSNCENLSCPNTVEAAEVLESVAPGAGESVTVCREV